MINTIQLGQRAWKTWRETSVNTRIFAAILTVGSLTAIVKLVSAGKELVIAYRFGTSDALDAFVIAFVLPQFFIELIGGALNAALIPTYIQVREQEGPEAAQRLLSSIIFSSMVIIGIATLLMTMFATPILSLLASGFSADKLMLTQRLFFILLPALLFSGMATTWNAVLNAGHRFAFGAVVPMVTPLLTIVLLLGIGQFVGITVLAVSTVIGLGLEAALLGWALKRHGIVLMPRWSGATSAVRQVFAQYLPAVSAAVLMGGTGLIAQSMAATLGSGSVAALSYGSKATTLLLGVGSLAVSTAVLPHFSQMVAMNNVAGVRHTLLTYSRLILVVTLPLTALLMYFSEPLVRLLLQRGAFTDADTNLVSQVQSAYLLQVPVYVLGILFVRVISSLKANHVMLWGTVINLIVCAVSTYVLMQWFQVVGIAFSISLMYLISTIYLVTAGLRLSKAKRQ